MTSTIAILALQGAFAEHGDMLDRLQVQHFEIREQKDLDRPFDGLILPGGESTVQGRLLHDLGLFEPLRSRIAGGLPVFGTCAGLLLLAKQINDDIRRHFGLMDIVARRNAYGRQTGSFSTCGEFAGRQSVPMTFIRAPYIERATAPEVEVLSVIDGKIVAAKERNMLVTAFHPELTEDTTVHGHFLGMVSHRT